MTITEILYRLSMSLVILVPLAVTLVLLIWVSVDYRRRFLKGKKWFRRDR